MPLGAEGKLMTTPGGNHEASADSQESAAAADERTAPAEEMSVGQYRAFGIGMIVVGVIGLAVWWGLVSAIHVSITLLAAGAGILILAGIFIAITGLKTK